MKTTKQLGIWMDYSIAHIMEMKSESVVDSKVESEFTPSERHHSLSMNENLMHNKERNLNTAYFKEISNRIQEFDTVLLFGPGDAKNELYNFVKANPHTQKIQVNSIHCR